MKREVDIDEISDGKRYHANDMVKISCSDCKGCSSCCHDMGKSIILDPYDIYMLTRGLGTCFDALIGADKPVIELSMADGILLPNLKMQEDSNGCIFLDKKERCSIHDFRPGICRLFPLGRIYEDGSFSYFNQIYECDYPNKSKIKVKKWIGIDNISSYEKYVLKWHDFLAKTREKIAAMQDVNEVSVHTVAFLEAFYRQSYNAESDFYQQIEDRIEQFISTK